MRFRAVDYPSEPLPQSRVRLGSLPTANGVLYRVWAPAVSRLELEVLDRAGVLRRREMNRNADGVFSCLDSDGAAGDAYRFRLDSRISLPDPASRFQPDGVHGASRVVDVEHYSWKTTGYVRPRFRDLVIYELHVGTFSEPGTFRGVVERLPYLKALGITAIELMPIADFPGRWNWGYDGVCWYAPARCYGHPDDLRFLIDMAHALGIAVIIDVVYNHFGPDGNYLGAYVGDYLDEATKTPWGGAIKYGRPELRGLRDFVIGNVDYWMQDFRIDGFRLDATHEIVDASSQHILAELTDRIHELGGYAIAEDSRNDARLVRPTAKGGFGFDAVWADDFHHVVRVTHTHESESYLGDFEGTIAELARTIQEGWLYNGQHSLRSGRARGTASSELPSGSCVHCISNHDQVGNRAFGDRLSHIISLDAYLAASALLCLSPHVPMLFMGQEWGASTPFLFFTDHSGQLAQSVSEGRRNEFKAFSAFQNEGSMASIPDPQEERTFQASRLIWREQAATPYAHILTLYTECLRLRRTEVAFRPLDRSAYWAKELRMRICAIGLKSPDSDWLILVDLVGGHSGSLEDLPEELSAADWRMILSTREGRFGGDEQCALSASLKYANFSRPELIVLKRTRQT
jgi:maltooligosyltrehalose trehalohydrolase